MDTVLARRFFGLHERCWLQTKRRALSFPRWKTATLKYAFSTSDIPLNYVWTKLLAGILPSGTVLD